MQIKKVGIIFVLILNCWAATPWETGWAMGGTSTFFINDKNNNQLLLECNEQGGYLYLRNEKRDEIDIGKAVSISVNNDEMIVPIAVDSTNGESDKHAWGNFIYSLPKSKNITINNKKFEPNNSEKLSDIVKICTQYDESTGNTQQNNIMPAQSNKVPVELKIQNFPANIRTGQIYQYVDIYITSKVNNLQISNIIVNRGNCKSNALNGKFPVHLKFGEQYKGFYQSCNAIEIEIFTDQGSWTFDITP